MGVSRAIRFYSTNSSNSTIDKKAVHIMLMNKTGMDVQKPNVNIFYRAKCQFSKWPRPCSETEKEHTQNKESLIFRASRKVSWDPKCF